LGVFVAVAGVASVLETGRLGRQSVRWKAIRETQATLVAADAAVVSFREHHGTLPGSLDEVVSAGLLGAAGTRDAWGQAFACHLLKPPQEGLDRALFSAGPDKRWDTDDDIYCGEGEAGDAGAR
jgi:hypothetical protein